MSDYTFHISHRTPHILKEHPDSEPEDHQAEFHFFRDFRKEGAAKGHAEQGRDAGPGNIDTAVIKRDSAKEFNPAPERLRKHQVTPAVKRKRCGRKAETKRKHAERVVFKRRVIDVAGKIAEHAEQHQEYRQKRAIAVRRRTLAPQE